MGPSPVTEDIWSEMHERLLSFIRRRVASIHDAEDILQDVFVRIHAGLDGLRDTQRITAWIYQIARNAIVDYHRGRAASGRRIASLAEDIDETMAPSHDDGSDIVRDASDEFARCMEPLLGELPEKYQQAVVLTELNGATQKEAAEQLGLSLSGMKARVQRGRSKLKDVVLDCCEVEFDRRGGLIDYERRRGSACGRCDCNGE